MMTSVAVSPLTIHTVRGSSPPTHHPHRRRLLLLLRLLLALLRFLLRSLARLGRVYTASDCHCESIREGEMGGVRSGVCILYLVSLRAACSSSCV